LYNELGSVPFDQQSVVNEWRRLMEAGSSPARGVSIFEQVEILNEMVDGNCVGEQFRRIDF
jgi:hypothetical protein